jgi:septum formation protein
VTTLPTLVLASGSPRRQELLQRLDVPFETVPAGVEETEVAGETPEHASLRLARLKGETVAALHAGRWVLAADTVVDLDGQPLGKPESAEANARLLDRLSGREHTVHTGHFLASPDGVDTWVVTTRVALRPLSREDIRLWVDHGFGLDKAGGYAIQGPGAAMVSDVHGCYTNVMGLSVPSVLNRLAERGYVRV